MSPGPVSKKSRSITIRCLRIRQMEELTPHRQRPPAPVRANTCCKTQAAPVLLRQVECDLMDLAYGMPGLRRQPLEAPIQAGEPEAEMPSPQCKRAKSMQGGLFLSFHSLELFR